MGRRRNKTGSRDQRRQYHHARRQFTDHRFIELQYRRQRSEIHSDKSYRRKNHYEQEGDGRSHQKGRVRVYDGSQHLDLEDGN